MNRTPATGYNPGTANAANQSSDLEFIISDDRASEYLGAIKHTNRVRKLKIILPLIGFLIILGIAAALVIRQFFLPEIDLGSIALQDGKLVMENPNLNGFDKNKRPFSLSASKAIQDPKSPKRVELMEIIATLPMDETTKADIEAGHGIYDAEAKTLKLSKQIHVKTSNGINIDLEDADIDIGQGILATTNPVFASSEQADISADSLNVGEGGEHLIFEGTVRMILRPNESGNSDDNDG